VFTSFSSAFSVEYFSPLSFSPVCHNDPDADCFRDVAVSDEPFSSGLEASSLLVPSDAVHITRSVNFSPKINSFSDLFVSGLAKLALNNTNSI
jgi:hypothetical protein